MIRKTGWMSTLLIRKNTPPPGPHNITSYTSTCKREENISLLRYFKNAKITIKYTKIRIYYSKLRIF